MTTLKTWFDAEPEQPTQIVFTESGWGDYGLAEGFKTLPLDELLEFTDERVQQALNVEFDPDFGHAECRDFIAWSANYLYIKGEYDGSEYLDRYPRNPEEPRNA